MNVMVVDGDIMWYRHQVSNPIIIHPEVLAEQLRKSCGRVKGRKAYKEMMYAAREGDDSKFSTLFTTYLG